MLEPLTSSRARPTGSTQLHTLVTLKLHMCMRKNFFVRINWPDFLGTKVTKHNAHLLQISRWLAHANRQRMLCVFRALCRCGIKTWFNRFTQWNGWWRSFWLLGWERWADERFVGGWRITDLPYKCGFVVYCVGDLHKKIQLKLRALKCNEYQASCKPWQGHGRRAFVRTNCWQRSLRSQPVWMGSHFTGLLLKRKRGLRPRCG